jgi:hypothetical protein
LCKQARRHNKGFKITGVPVAEADRFPQALEGPKELVEDTFLRSIKDQRQRDLLRLSRRATTRRESGQ